jgi:hypothetical protein
VLWLLSSISVGILIASICLFDPPGMTVVILMATKILAQNA